MKKNCLLLALLGSALMAQAVNPNFVSTTPAGGQRGTEMDLILRGARLDDTQEIFFYSPGITVTKLEDIKGDSVKAKIKIAPDCRIGEHVLRLRCASGISQMRIFYVGPLPSADEAEPNNEPSKAQKIKLNTTVSGTVASEDVDFFQVELKKDQQLSVEVEGARLGRTMFDPYLAILDANGKLIKEVDDTALFLQDTYITWIAPADGTYYLQLRDSAYAGSGHIYRLHIGDFPRPAAVFPLGGKTGDALDVKFIGDARGDFTQKITLPNEPQEKFPVIASRNGVATSPNWVRVSPFPNALEAEPNNEFAAATVTAQAPLALNGVLAEKGDVDFFKFKARKGQSLEVRVVARQMGSPLDSVIQVLNSKGGNLGSNDDSGGSDSYLKVNIPDDGDYVVKVSDHLGYGGPNFAYRVEIAEARPTVALSIPDTARYDNETRKSITVPRGNRFAVLMNFRRDNFSGDLKFDVPGLPSGIKLDADTLIASQSSLPVVFEATPEAPIAGLLLNPVARPTESGKEVLSSFSHRVNWLRVQNDTVYVSTEVDRIAAAVIEEVPFKISIVEPKMALVQSGSMDLKIVAERKEGFDEPINVRMLWNPPGVGSLPDITIPKGNNSATYRLNANGNAQTRHWKIAVVASSQVKGATAWVSSQLADIEVAPSYLAGKIDLTTTERGKPAKVVCKLDQKVPFDGKVKIALLGLPPNTTAEEKEITKDDKEVVFEVQTNEKSQPGMHRSLFCSITMAKDGESISQTLAGGGMLRIDVPKAAKPAETKPAAKTAAVAPKPAGK
ncbi:MAG: PPC domain-containing protein [Verrucomicrobiota bacterium]